MKKSSINTKEREIWNKSDNSIFGELLIVIAAVFIFLGVDKFILIYIPNLSWPVYIIIGFILIIIGIFINHDKLIKNIKRKLNKDLQKEKI